MSTPRKGTSGQEATSLPTTSPNAGTTSPLLHGSETSFTSCSNDAERPAPGTPSSTTSSPPPPAKQPRLLLTPAAKALCQRIYDISRGADETLRPGPWDPFPFGWTDWQSLQAFLTAVEKQNRIRADRFNDTVFGYYHDKLHLSYFSDTELAVIRMPSRKHELFISKLIDEIKSEIRRCITRSRRKKYKNDAAYLEAAKYAQLVEYTVSSRFPYTAQDGVEHPRPAHHDPDGSFCFMTPSSKDSVPGLIIEISYSQKRKALPKLADHYLLCTKGPDAQLVLAFDLDYNPSEKGACVLSFRRKSEICDGKEVVSVVQEEHPFRDEHGWPLSGKLRFYLSDFGRPTLKNIPDHVQQITLDFAKLHEFLIFAEERTGTQSEQEIRRLRIEQSMDQRTIKEARNTQEWGHNVLRRHRESSSPEQLTEEDEQRIQRAELREAKRARKGDRLYHPGREVPSSSSATGNLDE